jgi:hypothetical protein
VHVLPTGGDAPRWNSRAALRYRMTGSMGDSIAAAHSATAEYLRTNVGGVRR